ncbi:phosphodiesterase [Gorillibacterium massiliense]|uniref:phosphodiesterase n=1 Tax=Gorillibacterium massiliense TaxID=1280390 RepID=UPI0004B616E7|nr:phosphodiesterase [Gorillibacterium massiliense]
MKLFFMSDIHGSLRGLNQGLAAFERENADQIVILGDLLYHGPRNPLPEEYNPKEVAARLNAYKRKIISVRGNCDAEVDQMLIEFPVLSDTAILFYEGRRIYATHGHHHHMDNLPGLSEGDVFIQGHTHVPVAEKRDGITLLNPGSVSLPKENFPPSYGILEGTVFQIKDFDGNVLKQIEL